MLKDGFLKESIAEKYKINPAGVLHEPKLSQMAYESRWLAMLREGGDILPSLYYFKIFLFGTQHFTVIIIINLYTCQLKKPSVQK
jgi:hypothetical protein